MTNTQSRARTVSARTALVVGAVVALVAGATGALAADAFSDVPSSHTFHDEVGAIADAGITTGYGDGTFRPDQPVNRGAMAAFMHRGFGRVGHDESNTVLDAGESASLGTVTVDAGATSSGTGFVVVSGHVEASTATEASCPCQVLVSMDEGDGTSTHERTYLNLPGTANESGHSRIDGTAQQVYPIAADASETYTLSVDLMDADATSVNVSGELTAVYVPFGPDGDDTLVYGDG